jgi:hypothetical protein
MMVSQDIIDLVNETIYFFVKNNKTFTAFDITLEVRKNTDEEFFHNDIKQYIHDTMAMETSYSKELNTDYNAWEYSPKVIPNTVLVVKRGMYKVSKDVFNKFVGKFNKNVKTVKVTEGKRDKRKRLGIPKDLLASLISESRPYPINIKKVDVQNDGSLIPYRLGDITNKLQTYTLDSKGNIKISNKVLSEIGFSESDKINIVLCKDKILLKRAV